MFASNIVVVPDLGGITPDHWLSHWRAACPQAVRLSRHDPHELNCAKWVRGIEEAVRASGPNTTLVAQGLGCLAVAQWAVLSTQFVRAALLVSVPDPRADFLKQTREFVPIPRQVLPFRTLIVAAESDGDYAHGLACADEWDASFVVVGRIADPTHPGKGQRWDEGLMLLDNLIAQPTAG
jgi:predicted alpha/beta hydrolase family esterase